jgi:hypothetical protein
MCIRNAPTSPTGRRLLSRTAEHALRALEGTTLADLLNGDGASHGPALVTTTFENRLEIS